MIEELFSTSDTEKKIRWPVRKQDGHESVWKNRVRRSLMGYIGEALNRKERAVTAHGDWNTSDPIGRTLQKINIGI